IFHKMDFAKQDFDGNLASLSQGQRKKVLLAKSLCEKAHLYVWDEPLNYIDVYSRLQIENLLREFQPTLLFVEHDKAFLNTVATKTVAL
ncbi:MAG: ATP-binding cassette domain-containing protein, partial [Clostridiales bacterium]|nr:ATP-binding cassette domain-containing protein [Clostridiales bacterium]